MTNSDWTAASISALLQEVGESKRVEEARLRQTAEFYVGAVVTSLGAAVAAAALASAISEVSFSLAFLGVLFASMALIELDLEAYDCVRTTLVWKRLLRLQAGAKPPALPLELEVRMLTTTVRDLENPTKTPIGDLVKLQKAELLPGPDFTNYSPAVTGALPGLLYVLGVVAGLLASFFFAETVLKTSPTLYNFILWIIVTPFAPAVVAMGIIPGIVLGRKMRDLGRKADASALQPDSGSKTDV